MPNDWNILISSAYKLYAKELSGSTEPSGVVYTVNRSRPSTEPCGTPQIKTLIKSNDWCQLIEYEEAGKLQTNQEQDQVGQISVWGSEGVCHDQYYQKQQI